ncbi:hypothetical protein LXL04_022036 [Taraxacum kok-saghyz]
MARGSETLRARNRPKKLTGDAGGAVNKNEDHATEGPRNTQHPNAAAGVGALVDPTLVADNCQHSNVKEEKGGNELGDQSSVERPLGQLLRRCGGGGGGGGGGGRGVIKRRVEDSEYIKAEEEEKGVKCTNMSPPPTNWLLGVSSTFGFKSPLRRPPLQVLGPRKVGMALIPIDTNTSHTRLASSHKPKFNGMLNGVGGERPAATPHRQFTAGKLGGVEVSSGKNQRRAQAAVESRFSPFDHALFDFFRLNVTRQIELYYKMKYVWVNDEISSYAIKMVVALVPPLGGRGFDYAGSQIMRYTPVFPSQGFLGEGCRVRSASKAVKPLYGKLGC